jgi:hypothetical protein
MDTTSLSLKLSWGLSEHVYLTPTMQDGWMNGWMDEWMICWKLFFPLIWLKTSVFPVLWLPNFNQFSLNLSLLSSSNFFLIIKILYSTI